MKFGKFLKDLVGGKPPVNITQKAQTYAQYQKSSATGEMTYSRERVAIMTISHELRLDLATRLKPIALEEKYLYDDDADADIGTNSEVVVVDGTPRTHARMHDAYDKVLRIKKSLGKQHDTFAVIGRREDFKKYPRGTYPLLLYFCIKDGDLENRDPDLTLDGLETIEGPRLYNYADIGAVIKRIIHRGKI